MEIRLARAEEKEQIANYDRHIHLDRLEKCIRDGCVLVLLEGERVVGVLRYNLFWQSVPFVDLLYIDGSLQGQGYGRKMMAFWEAEMKAAGYSWALLSTQEDETAKFFYEKLDYCRIGAFLPPEQDADEIMYRKYL